MAPLDERLLAEAREAQAAQGHAQARAELARARFQDAIRRLHQGGGSMREIARAFSLSHQRVHQLIGTSLASCAFCGAGQTEVKRLVAGPGVFICDRCVDLADRVVAGEARARRRWALLEPPATGGRAKWRSLDQCSFCGKRPGQVAGMAEAGHRRICRDCLRLCREIIAEEGAGGA